MHSGGFELTKLTNTRLDDNLIRHRGDRDSSGNRRYKGTDTVLGRFADVRQTARSRDPLDVLQHIETNSQAYQVSHQDKLDTAGIKQDP